MKTVKVLRKNFSLIELLIVVGIMGALTALILPAFSDTESAAKDTACDYNQAGTLRYLNMFRAANGVYPAGFHTGFESDGDVMDLTKAAAYNFTSGSTLTALTDTSLESLQKAGIVKLAYGKDQAVTLTSGDSGSSVPVVNATGSSWTEEVNPTTGEIDPAGEPLKYRGVNLKDIAAIGTGASSTDGAAVQFRAHTSATADGTTTYTFTEPEFIIVPLFVAPTIDWDKYYSDGPNDSKISIAQTGKCPWGDDGTCRYYIAFFKVYTAAGTDGEVPAAKLLCTSCPDCGILEGDLF